MNEIGKIWQIKDGSHGLVVMAGDSCPEGRGLETKKCLLDGHFSHLFLGTIGMFV